MGIDALKAIERVMLYNKPPDRFYQHMFITVVYKIFISSHLCPNFFMLSHLRPSFPNLIYIYLITNGRIYIYISVGVTFFCQLSGCILAHFPIVLILFSYWLEELFFYVEN